MSNRIERLKRECELSEGLWSKGKELLNKYDPDQKIRRGLSKTALAFIGGGEMDDEVELIKPYKYRRDDDSDDTENSGGSVDQKKKLSGIQKEVFVYMKDERLRKVSLPCTLEVIEDDAFVGCDKLSELYIPDSVKSVGFGAFAFCSGLKSVSLPGGLNISGMGVFSKCGLKGDLIERRRRL